MYDDEQEQGLEEYKGKDNRYIFFLFNAPQPPPCKESNHLTTLSEKTRSLSNLLYILQIS